MYQEFKVLGHTAMGETQNQQRAVVWLRCMLGENFVARKP